MNKLQAYLKKVDGITDVVKKETAKAGKPVICKQGCFHCCRESVYCYRKEATHALHGLGGEILKRIKERTREWVKQFTESGMATYEEPPVVEYRKHNIWCPFLEEGTCLVYDRRPAACRLHMAVGPLEKCVNDEARQTQIFASDPKQIVHIQLDMATICHPAQADHLGVWLAELLLSQTVSTEARFDVAPMVEDLARDPDRDKWMKGAVENYVRLMKEKMNAVEVK